MISRGPFQPKLFYESIETSLLTAPSFTWGFFLMGGGSDIGNGNPGSTVFL